MHGNVSRRPTNGASFGLRQSLATVGAFVGPLLAILLMWLSRATDNYNASRSGANQNIVLHTGWMSGASGRRAGGAPAVRRLARIIGALLPEHEQIRPFNWTRDAKTAGTCRPGSRARCGGYSFRAAVCAG
jgi:hypothetical protein